MNESTSGDKTASSGAVDNQENTTVASGDGKYPAEFVEKLKQEKLNQAKALAAARQELNDLKNSVQTREQQELEQKQEYKKLYEAEKARVESIQKEYSSVQEQIRANKMATAVRSELIKLGLDETHAETALRLVDKNLVNIDPGTQIVVGADEAAKQFHAKHAALGFFKRSMPGVNHAATHSVEPGKTDFSKLSQTEKIKLLSGQRRRT